MEYMHFGCIVWTLGVVFGRSQISACQTKQNKLVVLGGS
jgi:hypothetical protein